MAERQAAIDSIDKSGKLHFIKICWLLGHFGCFIYANFAKALGNKALSKSGLKSWIIKLNKCEFNTDEQRGGDRSDSDADARAHRTERVKTLIGDERHWSLSSLASRLGITKTTVTDIAKK